MRKKLGGNKKLMGVPEPGNDPATPLDLALGITPPAPAPVDLQDQGINLPPLQTNPRPKKTSPKGPLAMMRPRVKCSRCDFTGKQGKEMDSHVERKHKTEFKCKVCNFVTRTKALRRRHMKSNHERKVKCDSCNIEADNESSLKTHRQAEHGIVSTKTAKLVKLLWMGETQKREKRNLTTSRRQRKVGSWFKNRRNEDWKKVKVWTQYAPHLKHIFAGIWKRFILYFKPPSLWKSRSGGGISPPWLKSFKNGGEFTPGGDITPLSFLSNLRRGGISPPF